MDSDLFQNWLRGDRSLLWCYESQGTGKTVLARSVYEHVNMQVKQDDEKVALSMISCSFDSDHTSDHLMANMLRQIAKQPKTWRKDYILSDTMKDLYRDHAKDGAQKHTTDDQIRKALQNELKRFQSVYIILDGLDELAAQEQRRLLLRTLHELKSVEYSLRIIVFSRKLPDIQEWFMNHGCVKSQSVELVPSQEYLSAYIDSRIFASDHLKRIIGERKSLVDEIRERVYSNASNTYLLAKLHIERLSDRNEIQTVRQLRSALNDLQNNFEGAYEGVFDRIKRIWSGDAYKRIEQFLFLVWQAKEPMSAPALEHALAALRKDVSFDHHFIQELPDAVVPSSDLVSECAGLVEMDETSQIVRLTHETIRNYLSKALKDAFPTPDLIMAESCLSYLQLPAFEVGAYTADHAEDKALDRLKEYCFLAYASRYWGRHAHNCADPNLHQHILKLVTNANLLSTIAQVMRICDRNNAWDVDREVTGLHVCAHFGLTESVRSLLEQSGTQLIDKKDARDTTALMYAVIAKHQDTVRVLLDAGATITGSCVRGYTALHRACCSFDECIWNLIVSSSKDISVNLKSQEVRFHKLTALRWAISRNYVDGVNLLLKREDTDVYVEDLDSAASHDYSAILQTLINRGFVGDYDRNYRTDLLSYLLIRALCFGKLESASVLLNHGANLEWRDDFHATPIIRVIDSGNIQGLEFIWKRANRYVKDKFKRGVLHSAARGSKEAIMGWMLERDKALGVNHQSDVGDTPLHDVVLEGDNVKIAKLLLDHKADATIRNYKGRSAVDLASDYDREGLLNLFLVDHGLSAHHSGEVIDPDRLIGFVSRERADVNRDQTDINVLQSLQMFTGDWIHACNYVPNEEIQPDSPLIKAIRTGKRRTAMFLLEKGANVDGLDRFHMTALHWASRLGYEDLVKDLVSRKANINAICRLFECKPVDDAASHSHLDLALYLLEQGDDESAPLNRTLMPQLLGQACEIGRLKAVRCLFKAGAPLFLRDGEGQSPRQKALSKGHHEIVSFIDQYI